MTPASFRVIKFFEYLVSFVLREDEASEHLATSRRHGLGVDHIVAVFEADRVFSLGARASCRAAGLFRVGESHLDAE